MSASIPSTRLKLMISSLVVPLLAPLHAAMVTLPLNHIFSDESTPPSYSGTGPWLEMTTTDAGINQVTIQFKATNLIDVDEHVSEWFFNVNPSLDLSQVLFTTSSTTGDFVVLAIDQSTNAYRADADGLYDVRLRFSESNTNGGIERFTGGDMLSYTVTYTGPGTMDSSSFQFLSQVDAESSYGPFYSAAHVNSTGIDGQGSAWVAVIPEPSAVMYSLLATGICLGFSRRRKIAKS